MKIIDDEELTEIAGRWFLNGEPYTGIGEADYGTFYYKDGYLHRDDGLPASEWSNGDKSWWVNGKLHRDNGLPAIEGANGDKSWFVNNKRIYSWEEYQKATNCSKEQLVMYILTHGNIS